MDGLFVPSKPAIIIPKPADIRRQGDPRFLVPLSLGGMILNPYSFVSAGGNDANTMSLLHMDGVDTGNTFTDSNAGGSAKTWTASGSAQTSTSSPKFGSAAGLFATNGYISTASALSDFTFAGQFEVDFQMKSSSFAIDTYNVRIISSKGDAATALQLILDSSQSGKITFWTNAEIIKSTSNVCDGNWNHIKLNRDASNNCRLFVNGTQEGGTVSNTQTFTAGAAFWIGAYGGDPTGGRYNGRLDEVRISNIARDTTNFTPPTAAYS